MSFMMSCMNKTIWGTLCIIGLMKFLHAKANLEFIPK